MADFKTGRQSKNIEDMRGKDRKLHVMEETIRQLQQFQKDRATLGDARFEQAVKENRVRQYATVDLPNEDIGRSISPSLWK